MSENDFECFANTGVNSRRTMSPHSAFDSRNLTFAQGLFDWARTGNEDVHESPGALLPVRTGRHMGNADQRAEQIERLQISTNVAGPDGALYQRINRSLDLTAGTFIELRGATDERVQCWGDDLLGRDVVDEEYHPCPQGLNGGKGFGELLLGCGQFFNLSPIDRLDQRIARRKVAIESSRSDLCFFGDVVEACFASSRMRSRLLCASVRGFRGAIF